VGVPPLEIVVERVAVAVGGNQTNGGVSVAESCVGIWVVNPLPAGLVGLQADITTVIRRINISRPAGRKKNSGLVG